MSHHVVTVIAERMIIKIQCPTLYCHYCSTTVHCVYYTVLLCFSVIDCSLCLSLIAQRITDGSKMGHRVDDDQWMNRHQQSMLKHFTSAYNFPQNSTSNACRQYISSQSLAHQYETLWQNGSQWRLHLWRQNTYNAANQCSGFKQWCKHFSSCRSWQVAVVNMKTNNSFSQNQHSKHCCCWLLTRKRQMTNIITHYELLWPLVSVCVCVCFWDVHVCMSSFYGNRNAMHKMYKHVWYCRQRSSSGSCMWTSRQRQNEWQQKHLGDNATAFHATWNGLRLTDNDKTDLLMKQLRKRTNNRRASHGSCTIWNTSTAATISATVNNEHEYRQQLLWVPSTAI